METTEIRVIPEGQELVIRSGMAPTIYDPVKIELSGTITAPAEYATKRQATIIAADTHVVANYTQRTITLVVNESDKFSTVVKGTLALHPELATIKINSDKLFDKDGLYNLLKFKGAYFKNRDAHVAMLEKLKKFEATVNAEFKNSDDFKGSAATKKLVEIKTNLDLEFYLAIPVFAGEKPTEFRVDIMVDAESGGVRFWLESVELHELVTTKTEEIFQKQLESLSDFVTIAQY